MHHHIVKITGAGGLFAQNTGIGVIAAFIFRRDRAKPRKRIAIQIAYHAALGQPLVDLPLLHAEVPARIGQSGHHSITDGKHERLVLRHKLAQGETGDLVGRQIGKFQKENLPCFYFLFIISQPSICG